MTLLLLFLAALCFIALGLRAFWLEPTKINYCNYKIHIDNWPRELAGFSISFVTDPYVGGPHITLDKMPNIVRDVNALNSDIIILGGDYVMNGVMKFVWWKETASFQIAKTLSELRAPYGVFSVLGNHDWRDDGKRIHNELSEQNIHMLEDGARYINVGNSGFWLVGISDYYEADHNVRKAMENISGDEPIVAFTHTPDIFPELPENISLTLAGHTHGGQVYLPLIGSPAIPSKYGQRYARGLIREGKKQMFVSLGIGTSVLPVRFMSPPEVSILKIYPQLD